MPTEPIKIVDAIIHKNKRNTQTFLLISRLPVFKYERRKNWLIAEDSGFFSFYHYQSPSRYSKAFAGREFDIPLVDGDVIKASGQWWGGMPTDYEGLVGSIPASTIEGLAKCHVFRSAYVDCQLYDDWFASNQPSNNYHKYDTRSDDFGKHTILSKWEADAEGGEA